ncbi:hypothetical protein FCV25MIE_15019 [Fagus crenata]
MNGAVGKTWLCGLFDHRIGTSAGIASEWTDCLKTCSCLWMDLEGFCLGLEAERAHLPYKSPSSETHHMNQSSACDDESNLQRPQAAEFKPPSAAGNFHAPQEYREALQRPEMFPMLELVQQFP